MNHTSQSSVAFNRKIYTKQRRRLSNTHKKRLATQASVFLQKLQPALLKTAKKKTLKVGFYYDDFGELPTQPILDWCIRMGHHAYLPVVGLHPKPKRLMFSKVNHQKLVNLPTYQHTLGMKQHQHSQTVFVDKLDVIFCPLVAVDIMGNRVGMGGGYYDRTLASLHKLSCKHPLKVAWCYDFQLIKNTGVIQPQPWDVTMDAIITPKGIHRIRM